MLSLLWNQDILTLKLHFAELVVNYHLILAKNQVLHCFDKLKRPWMIFEKHLLLISHINGKRRCSLLTSTIWKKNLAHKNGKKRWSFFVKRPRVQFFYLFQTVGFFQNLQLIFVKFLKQHFTTLFKFTVFPNFQQIL